MMKAISVIAVLIVGLVAQSTARDPAREVRANYPYGVYGFRGQFPYGAAPYYHFNYPYAAHPYPYFKLVFYGKYKGSCQGAADGLYYRDLASFVFCSNNREYVQPCPKGTKNRPLGFFYPGHPYAYGDFCSVNLVAAGQDFH